MKCIYDLEKDGVYYLVCMDLPMESDARGDADFTEVFKLGKTIKSVTWLDNGEDVEFAQNEDNVKFYEKLGFKVIRHDYYEKEKMHSYYMMYEGE